VKILVVGCGSIGRCHAINASRLAQVALVDSDRKRVRDLAARLDVPWFDSLPQSLDSWKPNGAVLATPTDTHLDLACRIVDHGVHLLIEKPIAHRIEGVARLLDIAETKGCRIFVVCNIRYHPGLVVLRKHLPEIGKPLFARAHYGNYLPNMRPGVDYRRLYCAHAAQGGGVILDAIHEVDYLMWFFGAVDGIACEAARLSDLDIDVEDYASLTLRFVSGVRAEVHLDYLQQVKRRGLEVIGTHGTLIWLSEGKAPELCMVRLLAQGAREERILYRNDAVDANVMYTTLISHFIAELEGRSTPLLDGYQALEELAVVLGAKAALKYGKLMRPEDVRR